MKDDVGCLKLFNMPIQPALHTVLQVLLLYYRIRKLHLVHFIETACEIADRPDQHLQIRQAPTAILVVVAGLRSTLNSPFSPFTRTINLNPTRPKPNDVYVTVVRPIV